MIETAAREVPMTHDSVAPTIIGVGAAARVLPRVGARRNGLLLIDANVLEQHPSLASRARRLFVFDPCRERQGDLLQRVHSQIRGERTGDDARAPASTTEVAEIIAIGGGSVLDAAKLLRLLLVSVSAFRSVRHNAMAYGVSMLPETWARSAPRLTLIPTTLGTGSEASAVACLDGNEDRRSRRLVVGSLMKADAVVLDALLIRSLDDVAVREGAAEILFRILGSYVGSPPRDVPDRAAEELVARVAALAGIGVRRGFDDRLREALAVASGETHTGWALVGREPFAAKHWYLANELASAAQLGKVPVTLVLLPAIWRRILDGDTRLGDASRLRRLWRIIAETLSLAEDPVRGSQQWSASWGMAAPLARRDAMVTGARSCSEVWGGDRPALHGLTETDVLSIYVSAFRGTRTRRPLSVTRREVN